MTVEEHIWMSILNCPRSELYLYKKTITDDQKKSFETMKHRLSLGEPLQYIIGSCVFIDIELDVNASVLIPRPETELLADYIVERERKKNLLSEIKVLDLGTGSGNIPIYITKHLSHADVTAVDISLEALNVAQRNAKKNNVHHRLSFVHVDMFSFLEKCRHEETYFDIIISNPPYIENNKMKDLPEDVQKEPVVALMGGDDGLDFYRGIIERVGFTLKKDGYLVLECGDDQADVIKEMLLQTQMFDPIGFLQDYTKVNRIIVAQHI